MKFLAVRDKNAQIFTPVRFALTLFRIDLFYEINQLERVKQTVLF
jgi:hypothetical protein